MKQGLLILILLLPAGIWMSNSAQTDIARADIAKTLKNMCDIENHTFQPGEELVYKIYYNWNFVWLSAGEVRFKVDETKDTYHLSAVGKTYPSYEWFYRVDDKYYSWINKKTLLPKTFIREVEEGKYRQYNKFIFDHDERKVTTYVGKSKETVERKEKPINQCIHDMISIMYFVRNMDFESITEGTSFPVAVFMEDEYELKVDLIEKNEKQRIRGMGKFDTHLIAPDLVAGHIFEEGTKMKIWISADSNKIPLLIESPVAVGSIKAVLQDYKGLKHDFTSKL